MNRRTVPAITLLLVSALGISAGIAMGAGEPTMNMIMQTGDEGEPSPSASVIIEVSLTPPPPIEDVPTPSFEPSDTPPPQPTQPPVSPSPVVPPTPTVSYMRDPGLPAPIIDGMRAPIPAPAPQTSSAIPQFSPPPQQAIPSPSREEPSVSESPSTG